MPTRLIREGILTSRRVNQLDELAELFYRRLLNVCDDYGRFFADETQLRAACYPVRVKRYTDGQVLAWRGQCEQAGLLKVYTVDDIEYLELLDYKQQIKAKSKFPSPADATSPPKPTPKLPPAAPVIDSDTARKPAPEDPANGPCTTRARPVNDPVALVVVEGEGEGEGEVVLTREAGQLPGGRVCDDDKARPRDWLQWAMWWREERGIEVNPYDVRDRKVFVPLATRWLSAGITVEQMRQALHKAEEGAKTTIAYLPGYVDRVLANSQAPPGSADAYADALDRLSDDQDPTDDRTIDSPDIRPALLGR